MEKWNSEMPTLTREQKKQISRVTNRYMRMKRNRMKRKLIKWMKIHKN